MQSHLKRQFFWIILVLSERIELSTSPLPRECSTPELRQLEPTEPGHVAGVMPQQLKLCKHD